MGTALGKLIARYIGIFIRRFASGFKHPNDYYYQGGEGFYNYIIGVFAMLIIVYFFKHIGHAFHN